jgi:hypothetical protein
MGRTHSAGVVVLPTHDANCCSVVVTSKIFVNVTCFMSHVKDVLSCRVGTPAIIEGSVGPLMVAKAKYTSQDSGPCHYLSRYEHGDMSILNLSR